MNLKLAGPKYDCLDRVGSSLSIDTKIMKIDRSTYDVTITFSNMAGLRKRRILRENRPKLKKKINFSLKKFPIFEFHLVFCL